MHPLRREAPAKINLGLHVLRKRKDGYHDIETVFLRIGWSDVVTVAPAGALSMTASDPALPVDERNTCLRAAKELASRFRCDRGVRIHLEKRVPYGAGLGSGSSDAAATLLLLNDLWNLQASADQLRSAALSVGSDVPFFLDGPVALGEGRGERLTPLTCDLRAGHAVVVVPDIHISSGAAYAMMKPRAADRPDLPGLVCSDDHGRWRAEIVNDFEGPIFEKYPAISAIRDGLYDLGAGYAALSGSGSAVFGLFESADAAQQAAGAPAFEGMRVWAGLAGV